MKRIAILVLLLWPTCSILGQSSYYSENRMNKLEFGTSLVSLNDGQGLNSNEDIKFYGGFKRTYKKYTRFITSDLSLSVAHYSVELHRQYSESEVHNYLTSMVGFEELSFSVNYNKPIWEKGIFKLNSYIGASLNNRYNGRETIIPYINGPVMDVITENRLKSWGVGVNTGINLLFYNRISLGIDARFSQYYDKNELPEDLSTTRDNTYEPRNSIISLHPTIGIVF